jgi:uncharacterized protein YndB with AHSA1/START domain
MSSKAGATSPAASSTDRIEKRLELAAPRERVWRAIATAEEFGAWFGMRIEGTFAEGATVRGKFTFEGKENLIEFRIERMQPERYFSYRWHPFATDPSYDYSTEPMTLVEFTLEEANGGSVLTIVETGFDRIPLARRAIAFRMNTGGWESQGNKLAKYVG